MLRAELHEKAPCLTVQLVQNVDLASSVLELAD